jgi:hypothetical protein
MSRERDIARARRVFGIRDQEKADAPKALADYRAAEQRIRDRTRELRELRLAREAASGRKRAS